MKKGFTTVELIASFTLVLAIVVFLFQIVLIVRNVYIDSELKTQLLNKQAIATDQIGEKLFLNRVYSITNCGEYCYTITYQDGSSDTLLIDKENKTIEFGNYKTTLVEDSYFGNINFDIVSVTTYDVTKNNSLFIIDIPIYTDLIENQNFGIKLVYQYNSNYMSIIP